MIHSDRQADRHGEANRLRDAAKEPKTVKCFCILCLEGTEGGYMLRAVRTSELCKGGLLTTRPDGFIPTKVPLYPLHRR